MNAADLTGDSGLLSNLSNNSSDSYYEDYEYDYDESVSNLPLWEMVPVSLAYAMTLFLGLVGNSLVIFSISYYGRMRTVTNVFLLSLASADLLLVLFCVPIKAVALFTFTWQFGEGLCKLVNYVQNFSMVCSVLTLTVISLERVVAVVFPLQAKSFCTMRHARGTVVAVWILSAFLALPIVFIINHQPVGEKIKAYWCIKNYHHMNWIRAYEMYMLTLLFLLPVVVMAMAYSIIAVKVWRVSAMRRTGGRIVSAPTESKPRLMPGVDNGESPVVGDGHRPVGRTSKRQSVEEKETRKQVVGMLAMVVLLFVLCWGPIMINNVLTAWEMIDYLHHEELKHLRTAFFLLSYFNSCVNPIVYAFFSRNFRQSFKMAMCACLKGKAFVRAYRFSVSAASTRSSAIHSNGRMNISAVEKDASSGNDATRSQASNSPDEVELQKITP